MYNGLVRVWEAGSHDNKVRCVCVCVDLSGENLGEGD